jgi:uncharacterized protein (TIGR04255 family)
MTVSDHEKALGKWPNAPLALVLAQVRFDPEIDTEYKVVAERLKVVLGERFPAIKAVRQVAYVFGPGQAMESKSNDSEVGRELRSDDNRRALRLQEGVMTYTTSLYEDSQHFLAEWRSMLDCLCAAGGVKVLRLGLRYIDFIIPTVGKQPEDYFKPGFGDLPHVFEEMAKTAFVSHEYSLGTNGAMRVQFGRGFAPPSLPPDLSADGSITLPPTLLNKYTEGASAVLDIDSWRIDSRRLQAEEIAGVFHIVRDDICKAFERIITTEAVAEWSGQPA